LLSCAREDIVVAQINVVVGLVLMLVLVSLLLCARELALPTFNPNALCDGFEDTVGVTKTRATGATL
jgi:hypothetical protein